ncbi:MAG: type I DNA topoisomerase [Ignavibacteriales bacterium]|jgi:DNA topoisomerase-1|nr:type I DNA topoisomerase [Ignavibacteriaceae bacterium]NLH60599.1 type I DNA topoisomerase [Ignavibacteriales bacterium]HOJ17422.1 type I DNA topoisomerase [Ignavibacteriaceae bacterium]
MKNLLIVESPSKAKTINKYLGKKFHVEATIGHIRNLPKSSLGIDVSNGFLPKFLTIRGKAEVVKKIKDLAAKSKKVFIATDPDREGEAIAQDIAEVITNGKKIDIERVLFTEITKSGIDRGMNSPRQIDTALVASQRARRMMDRIIGYKISPFLWKAAIEESGNTLSAGRVQSVALRLICERDAEILNYVPIEYWSIWGYFLTAEEIKIKAKLHSIDGKEIKTLPKSKMSEAEMQEFLKRHSVIPDKETAYRIYDDIEKNKLFKISNVVKKTIRRNPSPPFITSALQAEASRVLRFRSKQTMGIAQKLYEGVELSPDEGIVGLITYMRTDSTRISAEIISEARGFIAQNFGENYLPSTGNTYEKKSSGKVQDAHEAIRPTSMKYTPEFVKPYLDDKSFKLYQLIWKRFIASQMSQAILETTIVDISEGKYTFRAYGQALRFDGFMKIYSEQTEAKDDFDDKSEAKNESIPLGLEKNQNLKLDELEHTQHFTKPPPRYSEASLIKELESQGIGRPSTYSSIVSTIIDRSYVYLKERKLFPTELGHKVNGILVKNFPDIFEVRFTSRMEAELDQIAQGDADFLQVMNDFYLPFIKSLEKVESEIEKIICDKCGHEMLFKYGRFGKFLACSNYPDCNNIKSMRELIKVNNEVEFTGEVCEKCGNRTVFRQGKFGKFIGCEKYPECDFVKNITLDVKCPKCSKGDIVERRSKKNKTFYGCSSYPDCDFVSWNKLVNKECPECGNSYMEGKYSAKKGNYIACPKCKYELIPENPEESDE